MVRRDWSFGKLPSQSLPFPSAPLDFPSVASPTVSGKTPSTMSYNHGAPPRAAALRMPVTVHESLVPSDPRHDLGFLERMRDHFSRMLEMLGGK